MLERVLQFAIERRVMVVFLTLALVGLGISSLQRLPIDAVPDITNKQVQINTEYAGFSPVEIEQQVTFPIETAGDPRPRVHAITLQKRLLAGNGGL